MANKFNFLHKHHNDDTYEIEINNISSDEPIDLKQVNCGEDTSNDWDTSKLIKTKAFRIKDILGLDEKEKLASSIQHGFVPINKSTIKSSTTPRMC